MTTRIEHWVRDDSWAIELVVDEDGKLVSFSRLPMVRGPLNTADYKAVSTVLQGSGYRRLVE